MRSVAFLIVASLSIALLPTAAALGPADSPWVQVPPDPTDPLPHGEDTTKLGVGGDCEAGSYGTLCETPDCMGTPLVFPPCEETSTCIVHAKVCALGVNQKHTFEFIDIVVHRGALGPFVGPLPKPHVPVEPEAGVGGDCRDHDVTVSCSYRPSGPECFDVFDPLGELRDCPGNVHCSLYSSLRGCEEGRRLSNYEPLCSLALSVCTPVCVQLRDLSVPTC